jgi:hypothetical protein
MHNQETDGCSMAPMTGSDTKGNQSEPGITLPCSSAKLALRMAERSVDEINAKLRDAERSRDDLARQVGSQQDIVDRLLSEREYLSRHVREMESARGRDQK